MHSSRRDAFKTINEPPLGKVEHGKIMVTEGYRKKVSGKVVADTKMETDVGIIYVYPGLKPEDIPKKKGIVFAGTGLGHIPNKLVPKVKELIDSGSVVVMTSQCLFGRVNMHVYSTGRDLLQVGVISGEDMLPETAYVKLMWALAYAKERREVEKILIENMCGEISSRTRSDAFL
jgi:glutamyl-tRNA(Gln) amidotransferase subunit D